MNGREDAGSVDPAVREALRQWSRAADLGAARKALATARRGLDRTQQAQLVRWTAVLNIDALIDALAKTEGLTGEANLEWEGLAWHRRQLERLAHWADDQKKTAETLGVAPTAWRDALSEAVEVVRATRKDEALGPREDSLKAARKFLGF